LLLFEEEVELEEEFGEREESGLDQTDFRMKGLLSIINHPAPCAPTHPVLEPRPLTPNRTTKQTMLQIMLDYPDGSVHLETNGQTFIYLHQSLWTLASDSSHLLANMLL
jgi:hypothetical protein